LQTLSWDPQKKPKTRGSWYYVTTGTFALMVQISLVYMTSYYHKVFALFASLCS
jgi:hypothetical protein